MAGGLAALLDDIATLARMAAASVDDVAAAAGRASVKAAGVVVDDAAVTPRFVSGLDPRRELPIIWKIAVGSLRNKLVFILPVILLLSQFAPWLLTPLLMVGGTYLCFEGAEKVWELRHPHHETKPALGSGGDAEKKVVRGAITTDFVLSSEIMVIALAEVAAEPLLSRTVILILVALVITALVYGVVAAIVKMDDVGLRLADRPDPASQGLGRGLVKAMPIVLKVLSFVGILAMLWVGGHIVLDGLEHFGAPHVLPHFWLFNIAVSLVFGLAWGSVLVLIVRLVRRVLGRAH